MSKFNLKHYKKINRDKHIDQRLQEEHEAAPEVINEAQLEGYRVPEKEVLIEKLLEETRSGKDDEVTERRMNKYDFLRKNKKIVVNQKIIQDGRLQVILLSF